MGKIKLADAHLINERDRTPQCASCTAMADEGERFCRHCNDYWTKDVPAMHEQTCGEKRLKWKA